MAAFHGVLGEDESDAESVANFIRRLREESNLPQMKILQRGFGGCSGLLRKGADQLKAWEKAGCVCAYICYDADRADPKSRYDDLQQLIIRSKAKIHI